MRRTPGAGKAETLLEFGRSGFQGWKITAPPLFSPCTCKCRLSFCGKESYSGLWRPARALSRAGRAALPDVRVELSWCLFIFTHGRLQAAPCMDFAVANSHSPTSTCPYFWVLASCGCLERNICRHLQILRSQVISRDPEIRACVCG